MKKYYFLLPVTLLFFNCNGQNEKTASKRKKDPKEIEVSKSAYEMDEGKVLIVDPNSWDGYNVDTKVVICFSKEGIDEGEVESVYKVCRDLQIKYMEVRGMSEANVYLNEMIMMQMGQLLMSGGGVLLLKKGEHKVLKNISTQERDIKAFFE